MGDPLEMIGCFLCCIGVQMCRIADNTIEMREELTKMRKLIKGKEMLSEVNELESVTIDK